MNDAHFEKLLKLLEIERDAEKEENKRSLERYPLHVRETLGKTVTRLNIDGDDVGVGGMSLLRLSRAQSTVKDGLSPFHSMNQGDNVLLTYPPASNLEPVEGTLYDVGEFTVTVAINGPVPQPLPTGLCQLDLLGSDATYKRMRQAIGTVHRTERPELVKLREIFLGEDEPEVEKRVKLEIQNKKLNKFQIDAVEKSVAAPEVAIIHGPPGTGKTTVLVEVILQAVKNGARVLASAPSNIAVDNMVEKLLPYDLRIVRTGHPARVMEALHHVTLAAQLDEHPSQREIGMLDDERHRMMTQLRRKQERGTGVSYEERKEMQDYIQKLWKEARDMEFGIQREIIDGAHVVLATHGGINKQLGKKKFDLVVMDEASQSTEPLSWVPITLGKKVVFAGDSCQLPPTIYSREAADKGLASTLFDRLKEKLPGELQTMLRVQYRMHQDIMRFSSKKFYEDKLIADESVKEHTVAELEGVKPSALTERPILYIDTAGTGFNEEWNELLDSRENEGEANLAFTILEHLRYAGIQPDQIAILAPYVAQVKKMRLLNKEKVEIGSIDSFQGREKEVVILSLVRSNDIGEVGFLSDTRRMNVAMTRARRLLIVIGDSATISRHPFYNDFIEYVDSLDAHTSAWEWIKQ